MRKQVAYKLTWSRHYDTKLSIRERPQEAASLTLVFYNMRKRFCYSILLQEMIRILCSKLRRWLKKFARRCKQVVNCLSRIHELCLSVLLVTTGLFWQDRVLTDCGKHDLLCSNNIREYSSHSLRVQIYNFAVNGLKLSYEMQFTIAHS